MLPAVLDALGRTESNRLLAELKYAAPVRTGTFWRGLRRQSAVPTMGGNHLQIDIVAGGAHGFLAPIIIGGSKRHRIPKMGNSRRPMPMRFGNLASGGIRNFVWAVKPPHEHPGTKPNNFVSRALRDANRISRAEGEFAICQLPMIKQ